MATITTSNIHDDPAVVPIVTRLRDAERRRDELTREANTIFSAISPYAVATGPSTVSATARLIMEGREPEVRRALRAVAIEIDEITHELASARAVARAKRLAAIDVERRRLARALDGKLTEAARINDALTAADDEAQQAVMGTERFAFHALRPETPTTASLLAAWRAFATAGGML